MAAAVGTTIETLLLPPGQAVKALVDENPGDFACDSGPRAEFCGCHLVPVSA